MARLVVSRRYARAETRQTFKWLATAGVNTLPVRKPPALALTFTHILQMNLVKRPLWPNAYDQPFHNHIPGGWLFERLQKDVGKNQAFRHGVPDNLRNHPDLPWT